MGKKDKKSHTTQDGLIVGITAGHNIKRFYLYGCVILFVVVVGLGVWLIGGRDKSSITLADKCSPYHESSVSKQAGFSIVLNTEDGLKKLGEEIKPIQNTKNYKENANCLYPILRYHMYNSDAMNARVVFNNFNDVYESGFAENFYGITRDEIKQQVEHLEQLQKEAESSMMFTNIPPENGENEQ